MTKDEDAAAADEVADLTPDDEPLAVGVGTVTVGMDDGKEISVNVGSGFSDADRDNYWRDSQFIIGRTAEILCDVITQNQDGTYSLRFPRFVRFRDDK